MDSPFRKLWNETLDTIRVSVSTANFTTWFVSTVIISLRKVGTDRQIIEIGCPSSYTADALEKRYFGLIQETLNKITGIKNDLIFTVHSLPANNRQLKNDSPLFSSGSVLSETDNYSQSLHRAKIREGFTFENFAVSSSNQLAHAAAEAVSKNPGKAYNPLFLWGGVGVGKTHLMLAVGRQVLLENQEAKTLYCVSEEFTNEIVEAIRTKTAQRFKDRYRKLQLLMVDDVQFIAGKDKVQEEFFHTFNAILHEGGQVILTSDRPPHEISKLEDRLRNRFEAGMVVDISPPDFELRAAITLIKAKDRGFDLSMESAQLIAANLDSPRRIEGFLTRLLGENSGDIEKTSPEFINKLLRKTNGSDNENSHFTKKQVIPNDVIESIALHFSIRRRKLLGASRARPFAHPRQILMYILRTELGMTFDEVGHTTGGRDHTTVMHAVNKISNSLPVNPKLQEDILGIKTSLWG